MKRKDRKENRPEPRDVEALLCDLCGLSLRPLRLKSVLRESLMTVSFVTRGSTVVRLSSKRMGSFDLTSQIIGTAIKVHGKLGPGLLESAYEACLAHELQLCGMHVDRQKPVPLFYDTVKLDCGFRADLVVEGRVVVELKCKDALHPADEAQLLSHLRLLNLPIGLLINFHVVRLKDGIRRMVNNFQEDIADKDFVAANFSN